MGEAAVPRPQTLRTAKGCRAFSFERMRLRFELLVLRRQMRGLIFKIGMFRFQPADCGGRLLESHPGAPVPCAPDRGQPRGS